MRLLLLGALILALAGCEGADSTPVGDLSVASPAASVPAPPWLVSQGAPMGFVRICGAFFCGFEVAPNY